MRLRTVGWGVGVRTPKVDTGKKIARLTGESNLRQQRYGPMLYQLSYLGKNNSVKNRAKVFSLSEEPRLKKEVFSLSGIQVQVPLSLWTKNSDRTSLRLIFFLFFFLQ